jgi:uncharacterized protein YdcH (DUF465 family)
MEEKPREAEGVNEVYRPPKWSPLETLAVVLKCSAKPLDHYPKRIEDMTPTELEIFKVGSDAIGRLMYIEEICNEVLRREEMGVAADRAKANEDEIGEKEKLAEQLEEVHRDIKQLEKRKDWLKAKIEPLLSVGEKIGQVEKLEQNPLNVSPDLLNELEEEFGPSIVKRSVNTSHLRQLMSDSPELDKRIPRKTRTQIRVGESYK